MGLNGQMPVADQRAASLLMVRLALFAAGLLSVVMFPFVLLLMLIRDKVGGCNWGTSDISGTGSWDFLPPQLTCSWSADQVDEINAWASNNGSAGVQLRADATTVAEEIPGTAAAWLVFGLFLFGLVLLRLAVALRHRPKPEGAPGAIAPA